MCFGSSNSDSGDKRYFQETPPPVPPISPEPTSPSPAPDLTTRSAPAKTTNKGTGLSIPTQV